MSPSTHSVFKSNSPVHMDLKVIWIHSSTKCSFAIKCVQSMQNKVCNSGGISALLLLLRQHIGSLFNKRLDTNLLSHQIKKYPDSLVHTLSNL